jgi:hypothetical protein
MRKGFGNLSGCESAAWVLTCGEAAAAGVASSGISRIVSIKPGICLRFIGLLHTGLGRAVADNIVIDGALTEIKRCT